MRADPELGRAVEEHLRGLHGRAVALVGRHRDRIVGAAEALLERYLDADYPEYGVPCSMPKHILDEVAPRKGLSGTANNTSRINDLTPPRLHRLYQGNVPLSSNAVLNGPSVSQVQTRPTKPASRRMKSRQGQWSDLVHARSRMGTGPGNPASRRRHHDDLVGRSLTPLLRNISVCFGADRGPDPVPIHS